MCGVVGYSGGGTDWARSKFVALCRESCIRGVHAFGIAYIDSNGEVVIRKSRSFASVMASVPHPFPHKIIFHNRYCTSGDASNMENNQPISVGRDALVFNGTIDMGTKREMELRYGIRMFTENDGEIILRDFQEGQPLRHLNKGVSFAGIYMSPETMVACRNEMRPLWCFDDGSCKFICSTRDIASRAGLKPNSGKELEPYKLLTLQ